MSACDKVAIVIFVVLAEVDVRGMEQPVISKTETVQSRSMQREATCANQQGVTSIRGKLYSQH